VSTIDYYNRHARQFYDSTVGADMGALHAPFLALLPPAGHILDAGCGSGRDSWYFTEQGYRVTAFDGAEELVALSSQLLGRPVLRLTFQEVAWSEEFDGIWACASLLHVPRADMDDALGRLTRALKPGGAMFLSFKYGDREEERDGRLFNSYDESAFRRLLSRQTDLEEIRLWTTADVRPERSGEVWLDVLLRKVP
jgi:SAM-dependent methyltransferase